MAGLQILLAELESSRLEVVLVPLLRPVNVMGCRRVAASRNAAWYRKFCRGHASGRARRNAAFDTRIKRQATVRLLERMIAGQPVVSKYADELRRLAAKRLAECYAGTAA